MPQSASIVIPNLNGRDLLAQCLPVILEGVREAGGQHEVLVVDDASRDDSVAYVRRMFPDVHVLALGAHEGFARACNRGVAISEHGTVVLLNNDVLVERGFLRPLLEAFRHADVFAVSSRILRPTPGGVALDEGVMDFEWRWGLVHTACPGAHTMASGKVRPIFFACGACAAFDRAKFLSLGGFDPLYSPFYWEDVDLCYRAWKRGWRSVHEPASVVHHLGGTTTTSVAGHHGGQVILEKNRLLFIWKNITDPSLLMSHIAWLPRNLGAATVRGDFTFGQALGRALIQLPQVLVRRWCKARQASRPDWQILADFTVGPR